MASAKKKAAAPALDEARITAELAALRRRLLDEGGVKLSSLKPKALAERLVPALVAEGFESTSSWLRRPSATQAGHARTKFARQASGDSAAASSSDAAAKRKGSLRNNQSSAHDSRMTSACGNSVSLIRVGGASFSQS